MVTILIIVLKIILTKSVYTYGKTESMLHQVNECEKHNEGLRRGEKDPAQWESDYD